MASTEQRLPFGCWPSPITAGQIAARTIGLGIQYCTSRGLAVLDANYGRSRLNCLAAR